MSFPKLSPIKEMSPFHKLTPCLSQSVFYVFAVALLSTVTAYASCKNERIPKEGPYLGCRVTTGGSNSTGLSIPESTVVYKPEEITDLGCRTFCLSYNDPLGTSLWFTSEGMRSIAATGSVSAPCPSFGISKLLRPPQFKPVLLSIPEEDPRDFVIEQAKRDPIILNASKLRETIDDGSITGLTVEIGAWLDPLCRTNRCHYMDVDQPMLEETRKSLNSKIWKWKFWGESNEVPERNFHEGTPDHMTSHFKPKSISTIVTKNSFTFPNSQGDDEEIAVMYKHDRKSRKEYFKQFSKVLTEDGKVYILSDAFGLKDHSKESIQASYQEDIQLLNDLYASGESDLVARHILISPGERGMDWVGLVLEHESSLASH